VFANDYIKTNNGALSPLEVGIYFRMKSERERQEAARGQMFSAHDH